MNTSYIDKESDLYKTVFSQYITQETNLYITKDQVEIDDPTQIMNTGSSVSQEQIEYRNEDDENDDGEQIMADDSIVNAGSKYLVLVAEDNFGVEKYPRFEDKTQAGQYDPNMTPPVAAINFSNDPTDGLRGDFIAVGAGGDSLAPGDNQTEVDKDDFTGTNYSNSGAKYTDPKLNIIGSITDMLFMLERVGSIVPLSITPTTGPPVVTSLYYHNGSEDVQSLTVYAGAYYDEESKVRGCQISKFSIDFQKEDGILQQEIEMLGSHYKQDELKPASKFARYRNTPIEGWYLDSVWYNIVTKSHVGSFIENSTVPANSKWYQVGCGTSDVKIDLDFNLDEGAGGDFCSKMVNGELQVVDQYRGKLPRGSEGETLTFTLTREQHEAYLRKIMMGDVGATEDIDNMTFGLKLVLVNLAGESLIIGAPQVSLVTDGPHLERKSSEQLTFTAKGIGGFYLNDEQVDPTQQGTLFMHYYPTGWLSSIGVSLFSIKLYTMASPGGYDHPVNNCRLVFAPIIRLSPARLTKTSLSPKVILSISSVAPTSPII
ncbi:MAG: hypothetical protein EZS28_032290, partial [Streblomastix strix]